MLKSFLAARETFLIMAIVLIAAITTVVHPDFLRASNITAMLVSASVLGLIALGETMVIIGRGIDLSVSATLGLSALLIGMTANRSGLSVPVALLFGLAAGLVLGAVNGVLVVFGRLQPIIATLATLSAYGSLEFIYTDGAQVNTVPANLARFGDSSWLGLPTPLWIFAACVLACWYFGRYTALGRGIFATGNNERSAVLRGISTRRAIFWTYCISGALSGIAGFVYMCYYGNATATTGPGTNDQLTAIAIALIGGAALAGGRASFVGVSIASVFLSMALTVAVFFGVPGIWDPAAEGVLILVVVLADAYLIARAARRAAVELRRLPDDPGRHGQRPGSRGRAVLAGHGSTHRTGTSEELS